MITSRQFWAKTEDMKLSDFTGQENPQDPFKIIHHMRKGSVEITEKPNKKWEPQKQEKNCHRSKSTQKWTTQQLTFGKSKKRLFDSLKGFADE